MDTNNDNIRKLLDMLDNPSAYSEQDIREIIDSDDDTRETYRMMVEAKRSSRWTNPRKSSDVEAAWTRFENKHIGPQNKSRKFLYWTITAAASIVMVVGVFLFRNIPEEPVEPMAQQLPVTVTETENQFTAKKEADSSAKEVVRTPIMARKNKVSTNIEPEMPENTVEEKKEASYATNTLAERNVAVGSKKMGKSAEIEKDTTVYDWDSLIIMVNKQQLPDSICKLVRFRPRQYFYQQGLRVDYVQLWSPISAKRNSGYNKNCSILDMTTVPDTLSDAYVSQHPEKQQYLRHVTGIVLDENEKPIVDVWAGAPTDSTGHFSFWMPLNKTTFGIERIGYEHMNVHPTDTHMTIHMKPVNNKRQLSDYEQVFQIMFGYIAY